MVRCFVLQEAIMPNSTFMIVWSVVQVITILSNLFIFPIDLVMGINDMRQLYTWRWTVYNCLCMMVYLIDIIIKFNTSQYHKGMIVRSKKEIAQIYITHQLGYDVGVFIPLILEMISFQYPFKYWNILVFLKIHSYMSLADNMRYIMIRHKKIVNLILLVRLIIFVVFLAHLFAICWQGFAQLTIYREWEMSTWLESKNLVEAHWFERYENCLYYIFYFKLIKHIFKYKYKSNISYCWTVYFAITTMTTVGYGDITPANVYVVQDQCELVIFYFFQIMVFKTTYEACILNIGMILATFTFAVTFSTIGDIIQDLQREEKELKRIIQLVNIYLDRKQSSADLRFQIQKYFECQLQSEKQLTNEEEDEVISKIPEGLREQIRIEQNECIIKSNQQIFGLFSKKTQERLAQHIIETRLKKDDVVFNCHEFQENPSLYYIDQGQIEYFYSPDHDVQSLHNFQTQYSHINKFNKGALIGTFSFITGQCMPISARATKPAILNYIKRSDFLDVLKGSSADFETYCRIKDEIIFNQNNTNIEKECISCNSYGHYINSNLLYRKNYLLECQMVHLVLDKERTILKYQFPHPQERKPFPRHKKSYVKAIFDMDIVGKIAKLFLNKQQQILKNNQTANQIILENSKVVNHSSIDPFQPQDYALIFSTINIPKFKEIKPQEQLNPFSMITGIDSVNISEVDSQEEVFFVSQPLFNTQQSDDDIIEENKSSVGPLYEPEEIPQQRPVTNFRRLSLKTLNQIRFKKNINKEEESKEKEESGQKISSLQKQIEKNVDPHENLKDFLNDYETLKPMFVKFQNYYPKYNFNPTSFVRRHNWIKRNILETPGFGVYTFFTRRIFNGDVKQSNMNNIERLNNRMQK